MRLVHELRRRARHIVGPILGALVIGYFGYHTFSGDRGILAWIQLKAHVAQAEETYRRVHLLRDGLELRTQRLRSDQLDPDLLDERARLMVGLARGDELIVFDR